MDHHSTYSEEIVSGDILLRCLVRHSSTGFFIVRAELGESLC
jgi:hypothetical protein